MSVSESVLDRLPEDAVWRLEQTCSRFEQAMKAGQRPDVEEYLRGVDGTERVASLLELLSLDVFYRRLEGEEPAVEDYQTRFPDAAPFLAAVLTQDRCLARPVCDETTDHAPGSGAQSQATMDLPARLGADTSTAPSPTGRYRLLRFHARGGLGEVYVAEDTELRREVALKQIKHEHTANPDSRGRFVLEGEITGALEHPGIVPVYGQGSGPDGRPFYAMRFIRGQTLATAVDGFHNEATRRFDSLEFRQLLNRYVAVCHAVAYAHSRGILHRDLKPANIMLGAFGETLVVDWGLAKVVGSGDAGTQDGEGPLQPSGAGGAPTLGAIGTPAYMSPEQAAGNVDGIGPLADVYSLGATLYEVLTGRAPFRGKLNEVLAQVQRGEWVPPREVVRAVPAALDAVCRKAMAREPQARYRGALALARDVEHWLADDPVGAHRETWGPRARRWARKHPRRVTGALVLLVTAVVGLSVGTVLLERSKREAQESYALAKHGVNHFLREVSEDVLMDEPGMQALRHSLLNEALIYHEAFLKKRPADPEIRQQLAETFRLRGELDGELGRIDEGKARAQRAVVLFDGLLLTKPADKEFRFGLARSWLALAELQLKSGEPVAAVTVAGRTVDMLAALGAEESGSTAVPNLLSRAYDLRAMAEAEVGNVAAAIRDNQEALVLLDQTLQRILSVAAKTERIGGADPAFAAKTGFWLPLVSTVKNGRPDTPIAEAMRSMGPECWSNSRQLARALNHRGMLLKMSGRQAESAWTFRTAAVLWAWLTEQMPRAGRLRHGYAIALLHASQAGVARGRPAESDPELQKALTLLETLCAEEPFIPEYALGLMQAKGCLGEALLARGRTARAAILLREAIRSGDNDLLKPLGKERTFRGDHARFRFLLGCLEASSDRPEEAARWCESAGAEQDQLALNAPGDLSLRRDVLRTREVLVGLRFRTKEIPRAQYILDQRQILHEWRGLAGFAPRSLSFQSNAGGSAVVLAGSLLDGGNPRDALDVLEQALPALEEAVRTDRDRWKAELRRRNAPPEAAPSPNLTPERNAQGSLFHLRFLVPGLKAPCISPSNQLVRDWAAALAAQGLALAATGEAVAGRAAMDRAVALAEANAREEPCHLLDMAGYLALASMMPARPGVPDPGTSAVRALKDLVASGFENAHALKSDPRLGPLARRKDFRSLVHDLKTKSIERSGIARKAEGG